MNFRIRDNLLHGYYRVLASLGRIRAASLDEIRRDGFQRILVVATTAIGDTVLCTPLIDSLKKAKSELQIGFWVPAVAVPLFEGRIGLNAVHPYYGKYQRVQETMMWLRRERYDLALVANANDPDVIPMIWRSSCQRIIRRPQRNTIYSFMVANPEMLSPSHTSGHAIERNLEFCDLLGLPRGDVKTRIEVKEEPLKQARSRLGNIKEPWWVIHPGASRSKKQWGAIHYAELARRILENRAGSVVLTGSSDEKGVCDEIQVQIGIGHRVRNLAGEFKLEELAALFKCVQLVISGDTGPYHIAMAVGTPTVTLFAPWDIGSSSAINGPYFDTERHRVVETARIGDPISTISVERAFKECASLKRNP